MFLCVVFAFISYLLSDRNQVVLLPKPNANMEHIYETDFIRKHTLPKPFLAMLGREY